MATIEEKRLAAKRKLAKDKLASMQAEPSKLGKAVGAVNDVGDGFMDYALANTLSALDTATFGAMPHISGLMAATNPFDGEGYSEAKARTRETVDQSSEEHPFASLTGMLGGIFGSGTGVGKAGVAAGEKALEALPKLGGNASQVLGQTAAGAATGGGEAALRSDADLGETATGATIGGVLGGAGDLIGRGFNAARRYVWPTRTQVLEEVAGEITGDLSEKTGANLTMDDLKSGVAALGPDAMLADVDNVLRARMASAISNGATSKTIGNIQQAAAKRNPETYAEDILANAFGGPTKVAAQAQTAKNLETLGDELKVVIKDMDATFRVDPKHVAKTITDTFPEAPIDVDKAMRDRLLTMVADKAAVRKGKILPSDLIDIRQKMDKIIAGFDTDVLTDTATKGTRKFLVDAKSSINDYLKRQSPEYADVMQNYADTFELDSARRLGESLGAHPTKQLAEEVKLEYDKLAPAAQGAFESGISDAIALVQQNAGAFPTLQKVGGVKPSKAFHDTIGAIFGDDFISELAVKADQITAMDQTNRVANKAVIDDVLASGKPQEGSTGIFRNIVDAATAAGAGVTGNLASGTAVGSVKRTGAGLTQRANTMVNDQMAQTLGAQGADAQAQLDMLKDYMQRRIYKQPFNVGAFATGGVQNFPEGW